MNFKIIVVVVVVIITIAVAGVAIFTSFNGGSDNAGVTNPKEIGFNTPFTLSVGKRTTFSDGLQITLTRINDSRCPKGTVCVWAGEIITQFSITGGKVSASKELRLGTVNNKSVGMDGYTFTLNDADRRTATITVTDRADDTAGKGNTAPVNPSETSSTQPGENTEGLCYVGGCNGELCSDKEDNTGMVSTCVYKKEYACYQSATCERQKNGKCGWTQTPVLKSCLSDDTGVSLWGLAQ